MSKFKHTGTLMITSRLAEQNAWMDIRITELEEALKNIANGDTPWLDGYSETPGECYQKYAAYVLGKEIEK